MVKIGRNDQSAQRVITASYSRTSCSQAIHKSNPFRYSPIRFRLFYSARHKKKREQLGGSDPDSVDLFVATPSTVERARFAGMRSCAEHFGNPPICTVQYSNVRDICNVSRCRLVVVGYYAGT